MNLDQLTRAIDQTAAWTEETGARLGGVVNCAGVATAAKIVDSKNEPHRLDLWDFVIAVNLTGSFNLTRLALRHMVKVEPEKSERGKGEADGERGVVIFVSSAAAFEGQAGQTAYAASKGAIRSMTLPMARDLARHNIRVVTIAPGVFETSMTAQLGVKAKRSLETEGIVYPRRFGRGEEFAGTVKWILGTPYVNGETVRLSGGGRLPGKL